MENRGKPLISVIVPIYRVEEYLEKCVKSIINQTIRELEIILVDDGSPDNCGKKCEEFAQFDDRIKVIHKENGGLSDARNVGIQAAEADLLAFIDSDDYIDTDMLEFLYNNLRKAKADLSVCGIYHHFGETISVCKDTLNGYYEADTKEAIFLELTKVPVTAVNKLYKKTLFQHVCFPKGKLYEDAHTTIPVLFETKKVVYDLQPKYHYIHREDSITTKPYRPEVMSLVEAYQNNMKAICKVYPELLKAAEYRYYWSNYWVLEYMLRSSSLDDAAKKQKESIYKLLKKKTRAVVMNPYFTKARKLSAVLLLFNSRLYEKMALLYIDHRYLTVTR